MNIVPAQAAQCGRRAAGARQEAHAAVQGERSDYGSRVRTLAAARREQTFLVHVRDRSSAQTRDIAFCYTCNEKVTTYLRGASYPLDKTLEALQADPARSRFLCANRQFIVARRAVKRFPWFGSRLSLSLVLETPERIVISKAASRIQGVAHVRSTRRIGV